MVQSVTNIGVHEKWQIPDFGRRPDETMLRFPGATVGRNAFINRVNVDPEDLRPKVDAVLAPFISAGTAKVYLSLKTTIPATRNGQWNDRYQQLGEHLASINRNEHPTVVDFLAWHEPENSFSSGAAYAHYANKVREHVKRGGGDDVEVGYCAMAYQWAPGRASTYDPAPWREVEMDFYSIDVYSGRSFPLEVILPEHFGFLRWYEEIANYGTRSGEYRVTERGFETPSAPFLATRFVLRNQSIRREFDWLRDTPTGRLCKDYVYWNSSGAEDAPGFLLDLSGEEALAARIAEFARFNNGVPC